MPLARVSNTTFPLPRNVATLTKPSDSKAFRSTFILTMRPGPALMARRNAKSRGIFDSKRSSVDAHSLQPGCRCRLARCLTERWQLTNRRQYGHWPETSFWETGPPFPSKSLPTNPLHSYLHACIPRSEQNQQKGPSALFVRGLRRAAKYRISAGRGEVSFVAQSDDRIDACRSIRGNQARADRRRRQSDSDQDEN